jgi:hypothetical protein
MTCQDLVRLYYEDEGVLVERAVAERFGYVPEQSIPSYSALVQLLAVRAYNDWIIRSPSGMSSH